MNRCGSPASRRRVRDVVDLPPFAPVMVAVIVVVAELYVAVTPSAAPT